MEISFTLNGSPRVVSIRPAERLLDTLRQTLGLTGTKEGCGEGECGACTVLLDGLPANSCLIPTFQCRGQEIETIESVSPDQLDALHSSGATQCGACTPGVVMTALWVVRNSGAPRQPLPPGSDGRQPLPLHRIRWDHRGPGGLAPGIRASGG